MSKIVELRVRPRTARALAIPVFCSQSSFIPDYSSPKPDQLRSYVDPRTDSGPEEQTGAVAGPPFWDYAAPTAAAAFPKYGMPEYGLPAYGVPPSGGGGGGWWRGFGGGDGSSDDGGLPFLTSVFALLVGGYMKKGSSKSLIMGCGAAGLLLFCAALMGNPASSLGVKLAFGVSSVLAVVMGVRAAKSGKLMPAGAVALLSAVMSLTYVSSGRL